jgi:hypothetical protein
MNNEFFSGGGGKVNPLWIVGGLSALAFLMLVVCGVGGVAYYGYTQDWLAGTPTTDGGEGNQGEGNQGQGNQGEGNQGEGNQGEGNQGQGNQGEGNQGEGNQGEGEGNQGGDEGNQGEGEGKPDKGEDKPDKAAMEKAAKDKAAKDKAALDKAALDIDNIQKDFDTAKSNLIANVLTAKNLKNNNGLYTFLPYTGSSAEDIKKQADNLGGTSKAGKELQEKFVYLREQSFKVGGLPKPNPDAAAIVDGIATKLLGQYGVEHKKLDAILKPAKERVEYLSRVEGLLNTSKTEFDQLLARVKKVDSEKARELEVKITVERNSIAGILKTSKGSALRAAVDKAKNVPTPDAQKAGIANSLKANIYHKLIVEMFDGNPLTAVAGFIPAGKTYNLRTNALYANRKPLVEIGLRGFVGPTLQTWLKHFVTKTTATQVPTKNDKTNIYPICWLGIAMGKTTAERVKSEVKFKFQDGKYIATLNGGPIDIVIEIDTMPKMQGYESYKLSVAPKGIEDGGALKNNLLAFDKSKGLYITYGRPGAAKLQESRVAFRDQDAINRNAASGQSSDGQPSTSSVASGPRPAGYMLVTSDNKPALISTGQKLQWRVNSGEWKKTTGEAAKRLTVKLPTGETRRVIAVNLGTLDAKELLLVLHGSEMIVQSDAFEHDDADFNSYLLSRLIQSEPKGTPTILSTLHSPTPPFFDQIKAKIKPASLPKPVAEYLNTPTFKTFFGRALKEIGMADAVMQGGYDSLAQAQWSGGQKIWFNEYLKSNSPAARIGLEKKRINISGQNLLTYVACLTEAKKKMPGGGAALTKAMNDLKLPATNQQVLQRQRALATQIIQLGPHWKQTFKHYYIQKLHANIESELAKSGGKDLFTTKNEMINSFELQVLDAAGKPLGPIYKLALKDPTNN